MTDPTHSPKQRDNDAATWLARQRETVERDRGRAAARERGGSWARLLTFFAAAVTWYPLEAQPELAVVATAALLAAFAWSVRSHRRARAARELADRLLLMIDESLQRCREHVVLIRSFERPADPSRRDLLLAPFGDDGVTWTLTGQETDDLDFYAAPVGLFGLLNRTSTSFGARRLCDMMEHPCLTAERIEQRQAAIGALNREPLARLRIMAGAVVLRGQDDYLEGLVAAVRDAEPLPNPGTVRLLRLWSIPSAAVVVLGLTQAGLGEFPWLYPTAAVLLLNMMVFTRLYRPMQKRLDPWKSATHAASGYLQTARQISEDLPDDPTLRPVREASAAVVEPAALPALLNRIGWADTGGMFHALCNVVLFYDVHVAAAILNCVLPRREELLEGIAALAEMEALNSLACFAYESAAGGPVCYPTFVTEPMIHVRAGRHPLIAPNRVIPNDVTLNATTRMWVVTGPNMAGKSTLLRMCGVNCLLAQIGTAVLAEEMTLAPVRLMTDLQVRDNLADDESYFLAEVRHLRKMVAPQTDGTSVFGLMDEPFRGTNSEEQVAASLAVVEHLLDGGGCFLLATHERRLADLAERSPAAENHHFHEELDEKAMIFDYTLHAGPARTRNALLVLAREGYPANIIERAHHWLKKLG